MVHLSAPSVNILLAMALPLGPPHTNILKDDALTTTYRQIPDYYTFISSSLQNNTLYCTTRLAHVFEFSFRYAYMYCIQCVERLTGEFIYSLQNLAFNLLLNKINLTYIP